MVTSISKTLPGPVTTTVILHEINGTFGSPQLESIRNGKEVQLIFMPLPNQDSDKAIGFDLYGVKREMTLQGIVKGTKLELQGFFLAMEDMVDGSQWETENKSLQFKFDFATELSYNVLIKSFNWGWVKGVPNKITFTLVLTEIDPNQGGT